MNDFRFATLTTTEIPALPPGLVAVLTTAAVASLYEIRPDQIRAYPFLDTHTATKYPGNITPDPQQVAAPAAGESLFRFKLNARIK